MTSLIFGANCSPFTAQFVKNKNARRNESSLPSAVHPNMPNSHYMDDCNDEADDATTAIEMVRNISNIHSGGGIEIQIWTSNSVAVLNSVPKKTLGTAAVRFKVGQQREGERTLGLIWYPADDMLGFEMSLKRMAENIIKAEERPTKTFKAEGYHANFLCIEFLSTFHGSGANRAARYLAFKCWLGRLHSRRYLL